MPYKMNKAQFDAVIRLPGPERYRHFISKIADWQQVRTPRQEDGFVTMGDNEHHICVPLWPHPDYAAALATGDWAPCQPTEIDLESFKERWIPGIAKNGHLVAVFPTPQEKGVVVTIAQLSEDLAAELSQYL